MEILNLLAEYRTPFFDTLFQLITYLGQETLAVAVICWLYHRFHLLCIRSGRAGIENHFSNSPALDFGPRISGSPFSGSRRHGLLLSQRAHPKRYRPFRLSCPGF